MNAPSLIEIQRQWFDWLDQDQTNLGERLTSPQPSQPQLNGARLNIYRNNRFQVLLYTLQQHFPKILALVGADYFKQLVRLYSHQQPPNQRNLHSYGLNQQQGLSPHQNSNQKQDVRQPIQTISFSDFLHANPDIQSAGLDYLSPLAKLESALQSAYFATDDPAWDGDDFSQLDPALQMRCQLQLSHALTLLGSAWDLEAIVNNMTQQDTREKDTGKALQLSRGEFYFAVYRHNNKPQFCALAGHEYRALRHLETADIELAAWLEQHSCAGASLAQWISRGWISHFITHPQGAQNHAG